MALSVDQLRNLYRRRAKRYDIAANAYYLVGFPEKAYRRMAVGKLRLEPGGTVVEIGCGTGLNFPLIEREIGPAGRLIGVDLTAEMLEQAEQRVHDHGWRNVELVQSRASEYEFPPAIAGALSTFALTLEPAYDEVVARGADALRPGGRFVLLDFRLPERWPRWLIRLAVAAIRPFGGTLDLGERRPWESIECHLDGYEFETIYWGLGYVAAGAKVDELT